MPIVRAHIDCPSPSVVGAVRSQLGAAGARLAEPGEAAQVLLLSPDRLEATVRSLGGRPRPTWPILLVVDEAHDAGALGASLAGGADDYIAVDDGEERLRERLRVAVTHARRQTRGNVETALHDLEHFYADLAEGLGEILHVADATMERNLYISPACERVLGVPRETFYDDPRALFEVVHPDDPARMVEVIAPAVRRGEPHELEYRIRRDDGEERWVRVRSFPVRDGEGNVSRWVGVTTDETDRKRAELELRAQRDLLSGVTDALSCLLSARSAGAAMDEMLGLLGSAAEVDRVHVAEHGEGPDGVPTIRVTHAWSAPGVAPLTHGPLFEARPVTPEVRPAFDRLANGATVSLCIDQLPEAARAGFEGSGARAMLAVPLMRGGRCVGQLGFTDCTAARSWRPEIRRVLEATAEVIGEVFAREAADAERRELEERMRDAQRLESLGVLAGGVAHDFNNLLMAILGNTELAMLDLPEDARARESVRQIALAARRAAELTQQMLAYAGKARIDAQPVRLEEVVGEMSELLDAVLAKNAAVRIEADRDLPPIEADAAQARQVVMNLLTNAAEALGGRAGSVSVRIEARDFDETPAGRFVSERAGPGRYVLLRVADTGHGMSEAQLSRVFDPFHTTKDEGRGLGLAVVVGIVRAHGGVLRVDSEPGDGTTFEILWPAADLEAEHATGGPDGDAAERLEGRRLLVVDDTPMVRATVRKILEHRGADVAVAEDGASALARFDRDGPFDAVVLDVTMPGRDGNAVLADLRSRAPELPVLMMSGYAEALEDGQLASDAAVGFVQKPFGPGEIVRRLRALLEAVS